MTPVAPEPTMYLTTILPTSVAPKSAVQPTATALAAASLACLIALAACAGTPQEPVADTPPTRLTYHVVLYGTVSDASGEPSHGIGVGVRFAVDSATSRDNVGAVGGDTSDAAGNYRFEVETFPPRRTDGTTDLIVMATRYGAPGQQVRQDSARVTVRPVPLDRIPLVFPVPRLRLPAF